MRQEWQVSFRLAASSVQITGYKFNLVQTVTGLSSSCNHSLQQHIWSGTQKGLVHAAVFLEPVLVHIMLIFWQDAYKLLLRQLSQAKAARF